MGSVVSGMNIAMITGGFFPTAGGKNREEKNGDPDESSVSIFKSNHDASQRHRALPGGGA
jgi:hypothetical protein